MGNPQTCLSIRLMFWVQNRVALAAIDEVYGE